MVWIQASGLGGGRDPRSWRLGQILDNMCHMFSSTLCVFKEVCVLVRSLGYIDFIVHVLREIYCFSMFYMILLCFTWFYRVLLDFALLFLNLILFYADFV